MSTLTNPNLHIIDYPEFRVFVQQYDQASGITLNIVRRGISSMEKEHLGWLKSLNIVHLVEHIENKEIPQRNNKQFHLSDLLTPRELDVLCCLVHGYSNKRIAQILGLAQSTAKTHVQNIMGKLGVSSRIQAAIYAVACIPDVTLVDIKNADRVNFVA